MALLTLFIIFIVLVGLTYLIIKILGILIPFALWLTGFIIIALLVVIFTALFYEKIQQYFQNKNL